jgi:hypothetical protein
MHADEDAGHRPKQRKDKEHAPEAVTAKHPEVVITAGYHGMFVCACATTDALVAWLA